MVCPRERPHVPTVHLWDWARVGSGGQGLGFRLARSGLFCEFVLICGPGLQTWTVSLRNNWVDTGRKGLPGAGEVLALGLLTCDAWTPRSGSGQ